MIPNSLLSSNLKTIIEPKKDRILENTVDKKIAFPDLLINPLIKFLMSSIINQLRVLMYNFVNESQILLLLKLSMAY